MWGTPTLLCGTGGPARLGVTQPWACLVRTLPLPRVNAPPCPPQTLKECGRPAATACRWGNTPLDEARRVGAAPVCAFLQRVQGEHAPVEAGGAL